jgi:hypothetical protein
MLMKTSKTSIRELRDFSAFIVVIVRFERTIKELSPPIHFALPNPSFWCLQEMYLRCGDPRRRKGTFPRSWLLPNITHHSGLLRAITLKDTDRKLCRVNVLDGGCILDSRGRLGDAKGNKLFGFHGEGNHQGVCALPIVSTTT